MSAVVDDICAYATRKLEGSNLKFAAVLWRGDLPIGKSSVGLAAPAGNEAEASAAMGAVIADLKDRGVTS
jgi:hypothetical protein